MEIFWGLKTSKDVLSGYVKLCPRFNTHREDLVMHTRINKITGMLVGNLKNYYFGERHKETLGADAVGCRNKEWPPPRSPMW